MRRPLLTVLAVAAAVTLGPLAPSAAHAGDAATAETLFREGLEKLQKGDSAGACESLKGSNDIDPSPGTEINLGRCSENQGKLASAWAWYRSAAGLAEQRGQKERADKARKDAERLEPLLHKLVIRVASQPEGLTITRDGTLLPAATYGREVPIDPGPHAIEVAAKGKKPITVTVHTDASPGAQTWELPALVDAPVSAPAAPPTAGSDARPPEPARGDGSTPRNVGFVVGGAGIVALITGGVLQIVALGVNSDATKLNSQRRGPPDCTDPKVSPDAPVKTGDGTFSCRTLNDSYDQKKAAAKSDQLAAIITGAGGAVLIAVGATLILTAGPRSSSRAAAPKVVPLLGGGQAGVGVVGAF